jgi:hypothetical protein
MSGPTCQFAWPQPQLRSLEPGGARPDPRAVIETASNSLGASIRRRKPSDQTGSTPSGCWRADAGHRAELNVSHSTISRLGAVNPEKTSYR